MTRHPTAGCAQRLCRTSPRARRRPNDPGSLNIAGNPSPVNGADNAGRDDGRIARIRSKMRPIRRRRKKWAGLDSNQRRLTPTGLQPVPFSHSGTDPIVRLASCARRNAPIKRERRVSVKPSASFSCRPGETTAGVPRSRLRLALFFSPATALSFS